MRNKEVFCFSRTFATKSIHFFGKICNFSQLERTYKDTTQLFLKSINADDDPMINFTLLQLILSTVSNLLVFVHSLWLQCVLLINKRHAEHVPRHFYLWSVYDATETEVQFNCTRLLIIRDVLALLVISFANRVIFICRITSSKIIFPFNN